MLRKIDKQKCAVYNYVIIKKTTSKDYNLYLIINGLLSALMFSFVGADKTDNSFFKIPPNAYVNLIKREESQHSSLFMFLGCSFMFDMRNKNI